MSVYIVSEVFSVENGVTLKPGVGVVSFKVGLIDGVVR